MAEAEPLSPRKTALVLVIVGGCFAVLWPRLLQPALLGGAQHDPLAPNRADRAQGCCDVIFETDVHAIKIMTELCGNILQRKSDPLEPRTAAAFAAGKLPPDIIAMCRREVNATCGVDISSFLQQNVRLGKSYRQILEEVRSYNSSACLRMHFGVPTWELGAHAIAKTWSGPGDLDKLKQERPAHARSPAPHPAMRERGRAIPPGAAPQPRAAPPPPQQGRVRTSPLSVYYEQEAEPPPVPGVRPPLGGAGGALPPPKSSVGFVMPLYTICIVVFFLYTLCKILFKRTDGASGAYEPIPPDPLFRRRVFDESHHSSPEPKIVVSAISGLVAEVQQQMEASYAQSNRANSAQDSREDPTRPYTNGTVLGARDASPVRIVLQEYKEPLPEPAANEISYETRELTPEPQEKDREQSPEPKEYSPEPGEKTPEPKELIQVFRQESSEIKEITPEAVEEPVVLKKAEMPKLNELTVDHKDESTEIKRETFEDENRPVSENEKSPEDKQSAEDLLADALKEDTPLKENGLHYEEDTKDSDLKDEREKEDGSEDELSEEEIEYEADDDDEESPAVRQLRASVENDKATVKVLGMETTAHCEGGAAWGDRPVSPGARARPAPVAARPHEAAEVSSIYLEGDIPQQSRLLVADSATRADHQLSGKDSPVVLSGKMTLSLINDVADGAPERDLESPTTQDDDDFTTASAVTQPKQNTQQEELSEEEVEEEIEEEVEVEEIEVEEEELDEEENRPESPVNK